MTVELVLLRHAEAADKEAGRSDAQRELTKKGEKQAERMGRLLAHRGLRPDLVVASPAARAAQTSRIACAELGVPADAQRTDGAIYESDIPDLLDVLRRHGGTAPRVMLVGHNPSFEAFAAFLGRRDAVHLGKGDAAVLAGPGTWAELGQHALTLREVLEA